jgi:hypothetical protein
VPQTHAWAGNTALLNKIKDLVFGFNITAVSIQTNSVVLEAALEPKLAIEDIRIFLSKLTPFEVKTMLPDDTYMIERVIDPQLINVASSSDKNLPGWVFTQTSPQLFIKNNGSTSAIYINFPQAVDAHGFETPTKCSFGNDGIRTVVYDPQRHGLVLAFFNGFLAYLRDYSCFQSFSTVKF